MNHQLRFDADDSLPNLLCRWELYVAKWKRRTTILAVAFATSALCVIPFLVGNPLHRYFGYGKVLLYVCCSLLTLLTGAAALTFNFTQYLRQLRREHNENSAK